MRTWFVLTFLATAALWAITPAPASDAKASTPFPIGQVIVHMGDQVVATHGPCELRAGTPTDTAGFRYDAIARVVVIRLDCDPLFRDGFE